ncbi:MAG: hypothetical protein HYU66_05605 [Armatimonadetes bacterium]|nr:hypothetical protein [Armatimonadota bacterium]
MTGRPTDHAVRDLAALHLQVVRGQAAGEVIWQPRIGCWLTAKRFHRQPLPAPYDAMSMPEIYRHLGVSNRVYEFNQCFRAVEAEGVRARSERLNERDTLHQIDTPAGAMVAVTRTTPTNPGTIWVKRWVTSPDDLKVQLWRTERTSWTFDQAAYDRLLAEWGTIGAPTMYLPRVNVQNLYIDLMGVERAVYALSDWSGLVAEYFRALDDCHDRLIEVINASPIEVINFGDNLHAATLSPKLYEEWVQPSYLRRCARLHTAGKWVCSHWDGDCKPLLKYARTSGLDGIEAITPAPQGDVTLDEIKAGLGDEVWLLDGIPAIYFDATFPVSVLEECTRRVIELFAGRLILGISDELSSHGDIERIRVVTGIVDEWNAGRGG